MIGRFLLILFVAVLIISSCQNRTATQPSGNPPQATRTETDQEPNFNYDIEIPIEWTMRDTVMADGIRIRFLLGPQSLAKDYPAANVLIASMEGQNINDFTTRNMNYLKSSMAGIATLERGYLDSSFYDGQWFTYTKEQNGIVRDMINYIIPIKGFAYIITCGSNEGSISKYRKTFDKIARSLKG